jgi:hypothetical protein
MDLPQFSLLLRWQVSSLRHSTGIPSKSGLAYGGALSIGSVLGEIAGGMVLDGIIKRARRNFAGANPPTEIRLKAIWTGDLLIPAGLLIYEFTL